MAYYVYLLSNKPNGALYIGVTGNLVRRVWQHRNSVTQGFASDHKIHCLVWYETHTQIEEAIKREKQLKHWKREWKLHLIEDMNPYWRVLFEDICH